MKKFFARLSVVALALSGLTAISQPAQAADYTIDCSTLAPGSYDASTEYFVGTGAAVVTLTVEIKNCNLHFVRNAYPDNIVFQDYVWDLSAQTYTLNIPVCSLGDAWGSLYDFGNRANDKTKIINFWNTDAFSNGPNCGTPAPAPTLNTFSSGGGTASATDTGDGTWALSATADSGYTFSNWTCDNFQPTDANAASTTITIESDTNCTANFTQNYVYQMQGLGYWKNKGLNVPELPTNLGSYSVDSQSKAKAVLDATNCGVKNADAVACLAGHLLVAKFNINSGADTYCVSSLISDSDSLLQSFGYNGPRNYSLNKNQRSQALNYKNQLESYSSYGCFIG